MVFSRGECPYDFPFTVYKLDWQFARYRKIGPVPPCLPRGPFAADDKRAREDSLTWRGDFFSRWLKRENAISKEHSLREFPRCFQPSDEKSNVGQRKESPVARRIIRPAPVSVSRISEGTLIFFGGSLFLNTFPVSTDTARHALSHVRQRARREYLGSLRRGHRGRGRRPQDERQGSKGQVIQAQAQAQGEMMGQPNARMCAARRSRGVCVHARGTSRGGGTYASVISKRISGRTAVGYRRYRRPPPAFSTSEAWKPGSNFATATLTCSAPPVARFN